VVDDNPSRVRPDPDRLDPPDQGVLLPARVSTVTTDNAGSDNLTSKELPLVIIEVFHMMEEVSKGF